MKSSSEPAAKVSTQPDFSYPTDTQQEPDSIKLTSAELSQLRSMIDQGTEHGFYLWTKWKNKRRSVLDYDRNECQQCKRRGKYSRATIVHHVKHLRDRPDLALTTWTVDENGKPMRQLESLCKSCHEIEHPEALRVPQPADRFETTERWD